MELKISKIQWKKVLACILTFCMIITMVQIPVNAEETTEPADAPQHFSVRDLKNYEETATFFNAAADREALEVTPMEADKAYTVDPKEGYYDAKWFSFIPSEDGVYSFEGEDIGDNSVDSYGCLMEKDGDQYRYIDRNDDDDYGDGSHFAIKAELKAEKTYYLCAGYYNENVEKYNVKVRKTNEDSIEVAKHFDVRDLDEYEETATFFDAAPDRKALEVTPMEADQAYLVKPKKDYYDAKWFSFTPSEDGVYSFKGEDIKNNSVDSYGCLMEKDGDQYRYIRSGDDSVEDSHFAIRAVLKKGKTYYLCAGYYSKGIDKYQVKVHKMNVENIGEDKSATFSTENTPGIYSFTISDAGIYDIKFNWDVDAYSEERIEIWDENNKEIGSVASSGGNNSSTRKYALKGGETYYLNIDEFSCYDHDSDETVTADVTVSISQASLEEITEGHPGSMKANSDGKTFKMTVNSTGWYKLSHSFDGDDSKLIIIENADFSIKDESGTSVDVISAGNGKECFVYLEKEKTYILDQEEFTISRDDDESVDDLDVTISIMKKNLKDITVSTAETVTSGKGSELFKFVPDKSGYYEVETSWENKEAWSEGSIELCGKDEESDYGSIKYKSLGKSFGFNAKAGQTYYLAIENPHLIVNQYNGKYLVGQEEIEADISVKISYTEDTMDTITSEKPGQYIANTKDSVRRKMFKYVAQDTGYYEVSFNWNKDLTKEMDVDAYIIVENEDGNTSIDDIDETTELYMKKGQTYYLNIHYIDLLMDEEDQTETGTDVTITINISQIPTEELDYTKSGNMNTASDHKIFKFTAQQDGYHVLIYKWDNTDADITSVGKITTSDDEGASAHIIAKENGVYYRRFKCKKGETYYINLRNMAFDSITTGDDIDNVDVSITVAYYNGKTNLDTIKNTQPWLPDKDSGSTDKPDSGNTDKPDSGKTDKPDSGNTDKPDSGKTDKPDSGNTDKPDSGSTDKPNNNDTKKPAVIKVSKIKVGALSNKIAAGKKVKLATAVAPANASNKAIKWQTSNKKVAVVSNSGVVTVNKKAAGKSVVITAIAADGSGARATYKIKVMRDAVKKVTITGKNTVKAGKKLKLKAKVAAGNKANKKLAWSSSNEKLATVNQKGVVTTKKAGKGKKVKITAQATDGSNKKKVFVIKIK